MNSIEVAILDGQAYNNLSNTFIISYFEIVNVETKDQI
jgi:hypothetical protein